MKRFTLSSLLFTFTVACGGGAADGGHAHTGSGAVCPAENAPTYATFGQSFLPGATRTAWGAP